MSLISKSMLPLCTAVVSAFCAQAQSPEWASLITSEAGLSGENVFCISVADLNNDAYPDLAVIKGGWGVTAENMIGLYLNVADGGKRKFVNITEGSGVNERPGSTEPSRGTLVIALADINNDGNIDMVRGNYYHRLRTFTDRGDRCEVLLGDGTGKFSLVPDNGLHELGLVNAIGMSFLDYDKDGNIDLFIATFSKDHDNNIWTPGYLMKGKGDGTFADVTASAGINQAEPMYGSTVVDWNSDGWPDIVTAPYCRTNGKLWKNNGDGTFINVATQAGYNARYMQGDGGQNLCMWSNVPEDYDNDGDMDFFFSLVHGGTGVNEGHSTMVINNGASSGYSLSVDRDLVVRKSPQSDHLGDYDASWFDIDNDGKMDLVMAQGGYRSQDRLYVFRQQQDGVLMDVTGDLGMIIPEANNLHLLEVLDYDLDGDDDIIFCRNGSPQQIHLVRNDIGQDNNWIAVHLMAPAGVNKDCIGARIYLWSGGVQRMREVYAGRGNGSGQQPFRMLFGLGSHTAVDSIKIVWPDAAGSETVIRNPEINRYHGVTKNGLAVADDGLNAKTEDGLKIYPNPASDFVIVQMKNNDAIASIEIYDMVGRRIQLSGVYNTSGQTRYLNIEALTGGQYFIKATTGAGNVQISTFQRVTR